MKNLLVVIFIILFVSMVYAEQKKKNITVEISGIKKIKGQVVMALYNSKETFGKRKLRYKGMLLKVKAKKVSYTFSDIPIGDYALAVFHDINSNRKLDRNFLGMPTEPYAFSNNISKLTSPPKFSKVKFNLKDDYSMKIELR